MLALGNYINNHKVWSHITLPHRVEYARFCVRTPNDLRKGYRMKALTGKRSYRVNTMDVKPLDKLEILKALKRGYP